MPPLEAHRLGHDDCLGRLESLGTGLGAVHDRVTAIETKGVLELVEALTRRLVAAVDQPAIGLDEDGRTEIAVAIPPIARAPARTAVAEDAFVVAVELPAILWRL